MTLRKTVPFNLMVAGHTRAGKTDFLHTLFETVKVVRFTPLNTPSASSSLAPPASSASSMAFSNQLFPDEVTIPTCAACAIECFPEPDLLHKISLGLIDCPGLSIPSGLARAPQSSIDALERYAAAWARGIIEYCESQFRTRLENESKIKRVRERDSQVHACLFLLSPDVVLANHGLSSMDVIALKIICEKVNVIPCIAKSDLVSVRELRKIKEYLLQCFRQEGLPIFQFADDEEGDEEDDKQASNEINDKVPFCLVNSEELAPASENKEREMGVLINGEKILGREFIWGVIDVENTAHCDLSLLKNAIFYMHLDDLKDGTDDYYEKWRTLYMNKNRRSMFIPADLTGLVESLEKVDLEKENSIQSKKSSKSSHLPKASQEVDDKRLSSSSGQISQIPSNEVVVAATEVVEQLPTPRLEVGDE